MSRRGISRVAALDLISSVFVTASCGHFLSVADGRPEAFAATILMTVSLSWLLAPFLPDRHIRGDS